MSAPTADGAAVHEGSEPARESPGGVLGVAFGLCLIAGLAFFVWSRKARPIDGHELVASAFELRELPFGLEIAAASALAGGERLVVLEKPGAVEPERPAGADGGADEPASEAGAEAVSEEERFDWSAVAAGEPGAAPIRAFLIWYPPGEGQAAIDRQFRDVLWQDLRDFGAAGGRLTREKGTLAWADYEAGYVIERELERGGTFRDWARVNLSLQERTCVLIARWPRGSPASKERVEELLEGLRPRVASVTDARQG